jgi:serine/threonine protein kinase
VLVTQSDDEALPKVIDFGISKAMAGTGAESEAYTGIHQMLGTPAYMSPEQAGAHRTRSIHARISIHSAR